MPLSCRDDKTIQTIDCTKRLHMKYQKNTNRK